MRCVCNSVGPFAVIYFVQILLVGNFILLNLFLAILLKYTEGMGCTDDEDAIKPIVDEGVFSLPVKKPEE